jgi:hypothetical protein
VATVTGYTASRIQEIEDQAIIGGHITGDNLILERNNGGTVNAGNVRGPQGNVGPSGSVGGTVGANDNRIVRSDGTAGTVVQGSLASIDDVGRITAPLMTVTTAPSVSTDVVNKSYSDAGGKGVLGAVSNATDVGLAIGSWVTLTGMSITITPEVGRYYRFTTEALFGGILSGAITYCVLAVFKSTDLVNPVFRSNISLPQDAIEVPRVSASINRVIAIPSGWGTSTTFVVRAWINNYAGVSGSVQPQTFSIEDVGTV